MRVRNPFRRDPAPPAFGNGQLIPEASTNWLSFLTLGWLSPLLSVGYSRPLAQDDLWGLPNHRLTQPLTDQLETLYYQRCKPSERPRHLRERLASADPVDTPSGDASPEVAEKPENPNPEAESAPANKPEESNVAPLLQALHAMIFRRFWTAGAMAFCAETLQTTTPLLSKVLLTWLVESYAYGRLTEAERLAVGLGTPRGIGYGIGVAFGIFAMQGKRCLSFWFTSYLTILTETGSISIAQQPCTQNWLETSSVNLCACPVVREGEHSVGQIITMISTDATNIEQFMSFAHTTWVSPIQLILGFGLLIGTLGYSALVGLGVMIFAMPVQGILVKIFFDQRQKCAKITDKRTQLTTEVLQGIRMIKFYGWEAFYIEQIGHFRGQEVKTLRKGALAISSLICNLSFHAHFGHHSFIRHNLNIAVIFASLQLFNVIRIPLLLLPLALSSLASAVVALRRMAAFLVAEELQEPYLLQEGSSLALDVDADFTWETVKKPKGEKGKDEQDKMEEKPASDKKKGKASQKEVGKVSEKGKESLPITIQDVATGEEAKEDRVEDPPFEVKGLRLAIPKGSFVGIVGRVGSGKSSVLQGIIGEMRRTRGEVIVGGKIAYAPQTAWIQNASLRDNILFGQADDETRFRDVVRSCSLQHDIDILPFGEQTEIGEKGINLSGGQKARVSLARVAYSNCEIVLLDDPLSAVDAYVGKAILDDCLLSGPLASRTRVLVTHSLHVLPRTDYIYVLENGAIAEQGTYKELMANGKAFSRLIDDYGQADSQGQDGKGTRLVSSTDGLKADSSSEGLDADAKDVLMQLEERSTGAVTWNTYKTYIRYAGGLTWAPILGGLLILGQALSVGTNLWLGFWTSGEVPGFSNGQYMAVYAGFGASEAVVTFLLAFSFFAMGLIASLRLFKSALSGILHSPLSFFDTTPMGRILSRLTKDIETLDNELAQIIYSFLTIFLSLFGIMALVFYTFPYLGIIFAPMSLLYYLMSRYYRATSVETKRLDSILRSGLYASFSEMLTGLSTIRAFSGQNRATLGAYEGLDMQNRAFYMTITVQRWLALRLDLFGNLLVLGIGLFAAGFRESVNPAKVGVVLSYTLGITAVFSEMVSQFATNEQNMNAVERIVHYAQLATEGERQKPQDPPASWPAEGSIKFDNVELAYREGLPLVLKGVSFEIKPREKVGIVGRTGAAAGKSSLLHALFRTVKLPQGTIQIDGIDIEQVGLETLRTRLALVPQESVLFIGTLRENIDPLRQRTDAELLSVLQRVGLLPPAGTSDAVAESKFGLDSVIGDEGSNYSVGEKQLLSLTRALVRRSQVIVLDEATSNVDLETDAKLQKTIRTEFASSTVLCIAHRLNTIAYYDRILVMDNGHVAEFDTVLNLFDSTTSIFRSLCEEANLSREDILRIRAE
ncbi:cadmium ion transporter [Coprinopsis sp. MPI-PUGE-AT-0042]|nr:cadmium ion transporter [Coprinopsis sp. MPI-PUGE-AT-0042]